MRWGALHKYILCMTYFVITIIHAEEAPEYYGTYAYQNGEYIEIKDARKFMELQGDVQFLVFDKNIRLLGDHIQMVPSLFVRNMIIVGPGGSMRSNPQITAYNKWRPSEKARVATRTKPVPGQPEQIYIVPRTKLSDGAYSLLSGGRPLAYFFVGKKTIFSNLEGSSSCVDIEVSDGFALMMGAGGKEVSCSTSHVSETENSAATAHNPQPRTNADDIPDETIRIITSKYYDEEGEFAGVCRIGRIEKARLVRIDNDTAVAHIKYRYIPIPGNRLGLNGAGYDQRTFTLVRGASGWMAINMGGPMSGSVD